MRIQPIVQNQNNTNFQAVHEKYIRRAAKSHECIGNVSGDILNNIADAVHFRIISRKDGLDTLNAIKKYAVMGNAWEYLYHIIETDPCAID